MDDPAAQAILNQYFRRLERALGDLPAQRRAALVEDLRAHVQECLRAEPEVSDATVIRVLDRVGDPDEIAREARAAEEMSPSKSRRRGRAADLLPPGRPRRLATAGAVVILIMVMVAGALVGESASSNRTQATGRLAAVRTQAGLVNGWLPSDEVSGDHQSPGASDCSPQTLSGSESASTLEADATQVASGNIDGHAWSVWSKNGDSGSDGLENGGIIIDGVAHGLCPGFPNPGEMELLEPAGGGHGIAYGVIGYNGPAKVDLYRDTFGNFATTTLLAKTTAQKVNGVGFFITTLTKSACGIPAIEMNTASAQKATEHNLAFSTNDCSDGQLVPINDSQGIWDLPARLFPDKFSRVNGGGFAPTADLVHGWLPSSDVSGDHHSPGASACSPQTLTGSESASTLEADASQVASGNVNGHAWSVWSKNGDHGSDGLENGGIIIDGIAHGLCPGFPNPGEMELLEPAQGGHGIAYGVIGYNGPAKVHIYQDIFGNFATTTLIATTTAQKVNGVGFFITTLIKSACDIPAIEMNTTSAHDNTTQHNLAFSSQDCSNGKLVPISDSQGMW